MVIDPALVHQLPNQGHEFNEIAIKRLTPAGPDHAQVAAIAGIIDYFEQLDAHHYPERDLLRRLPECVPSFVSRKLA